MIVTGVSPGGIGQETARAIATKEPKLLVIAGRDSAKYVIDDLEDMLAMDMLYMTARQARSIAQNHQGSRPKRQHANRHHRSCIPPISP